ncbi:MAG: Trk system potassium transporter TrkA [Planctomycetota bacterium]|nr:Trk system potassium transporter TrkA [Planctomycetota bacterium]
MNIVIVGAGSVGFNLAEQLSAEGHDISVIDQSGTRARRMNDRMDVLAVEGNATSPSVMEKARIAEAEMLVAVTDSDEVNMLACLLSSHYRVKWKIARVRNPEISSGEGPIGPAELAVDYMINPDEATVDSMIRLIETPGALEVANFGVDETLLLGFDVPEDAPIAGKMIADIRAAIDEFPLVVAISRGEEMIIPKGPDTIEAGDDIYVVLHRDTLPFFLPCVNRRADEVEKVIIYGATRTSIAFAQRLEENKVIVTIIEPDEEVAAATASKLDRALVLHGVATEPDLLHEANVALADFFVAVSPDDNSNLMAALLARKLGAKKLMVMTSEPEYVPIMESIDIDAVINPRIVTFSEILRVIRRGVESIVRIKDGRAEGVLLHTQKGQKVIGQTVQKIGKAMPYSTIIAAVIRSDQLIIPNGDTVIERNDSVFVFGLPEAIPRAEKLLAKKKLLGGD